MRNRIAVAALVTWSLLGVGCEMEGQERGPTITWWAVRPHRDRGPCTRCHMRVDGAGNPVPTITSASRMPHMDRGVCSNCHPIAVGNGPARPGGAGAGRQVGLARPVPGGGPTSF